jgi:hypothetical protein
MQKLSLLKDNEIITKGSIVRLFEVGRFDIMKSSLDRKNHRKKEIDFYDYMIVDCGIIKGNTFSLINITSDNDNRGTILCIIHGLNMNGQLTALQLKQYFGSKKKSAYRFN